MRKETKSRLIISIALFLLLIIGLYLFGPYWNIIDGILNLDLFPKTTSNYVLVFISPHGESPNNALLISDPDEIDRIFHLVNKGISWSPCYDDIHIEFWESFYDLEFKETVDEDCSRYSLWLKPYFLKLRKQPTHYIYDIQIPVDILPETVIEDFKSLGLDLFRLYGPNINLPNIYIHTYWFPEESDEFSIQTEEAGIKYFQSIIDLIGETYPIDNTNELRCGYLNKGGVQGCSLSASLYFELGSDLSDIERFEEELDLLSLHVNDDDFYYLQLFINDSNHQYVNSKILSMLNYVTDVKKFPSY